jgi:peptide/nickel transport system substrate-binding protein
LIFALPADVSSLAPFGILLGIAHQGKELAYESLVEYDKDLNIQPALAESWKNTDPTTWVFNLRKGVKFHDGKDFKAEDVVYSLTLGPNATQVDKSAAPVAGFIADIKSVEAVDDYTVKVITNNPDATVLGWFAWARWSVIASKDIYDKYKPSVQANGTGPYKLVEYVQNDHLTYERNPNYWKSGQPYLDKITYKIIPDQSARVAALRAGAIDVCPVTSYDAARPLENDPNVTIYSGFTGENRVLQITAKGDGKPQDDKRVRQAISMAINRKDINDKVYGGKAQLTASIPAGWGKYGIPTDELAKNPYLTFNPNGAKDLLKAAGFANGFDIDLIAPVGEYQTLGEIIKDNLAQVGIRVNLRILDAATFSAAYANGNFEMLLNAQGFRRDPVGKLTQYGQPDQAPQSTWWNYPKGWKNDQLIAQYKQAVSTLDEATRAPIIQQMQRTGLEESTFVYLAVPPFINLTRKRVQNWYIDFMGFNHALRTAWVTDAS